MSPRRMDVVRLLAALLGAVVLCGPFVFSSAGAAQACGHRSGHWRVLAAPDFTRGPPKPVDHAVDPQQPLVLYATNGGVVMKTSDGGCSWRAAYSPSDTPLPDQPFASANTSITSVVAADGGRVFVTIAERTGAATRPHVVVGEDRGSSWRSGDIGLPPAGEPEELVSVPADPALAYLTIDVGGGALDLLYATTDGGRTWSARSDLSESMAGAGIEGLEVDPADPSSIWAHGAGGLFHSSDGGRSFRRVKEFEGAAAGPVDVFHRAGPARIVAFRPEVGDLLRSDDGGRTWLKYSAPVLPTSLAHGAGPNDLIVSAADSAFAYHAVSYSWLGLEPPRRGVTDFVADRSADPTFVGRVDDALLFYDGPLGADLDVDLARDLIDVPLLQTPKLLEARPPSLGPAGKRVALDAGDSTTVDYHLALPARPIPLDVFFLVDTSFSMRGPIDEIARSLADVVNGLARRNIDAHFGLGSYRAYRQSTAPRPDESTYVYRREVDVNPASGALRSALQRLVADSGGAYEAHTAGLFQLATGAGQDDDPAGPLGTDVPPGRQANFRAKSLRVVIHATDQRFGRPVTPPLTPGNPIRPTPPDMPTPHEAAAALRDRNILQVGLSIGRAGRDDLAQIAGATGALTPRRGLDCDGDGRDELSAGDPLVCVVQSRAPDEGGNLVDALVGLLEAVPQRTSVALDATAGDEVVRGISPSLRRDVSLQTARRLDYAVTFACPLRLAGSEHEVTLRAVEEARLLDEAPALVRCRNRVKDKDPAPIDPIGAAAVGVAAVPPGPPPPPATELSGATSTQAQSQAQAHSQAAAAAQERQQPGTAFVHAYHAQKEELAFASYRGRAEPVSPLVVLGVGGILTVAFFGVLEGLRRGQAPAWARVHH